LDRDQTRNSFNSEHTTKCGKHTTFSCDERKKAASIMLAAFSKVGTISKGQTAHRQAGSTLAFISGANLAQILQLVCMA